MQFDLFAQQNSGQQPTTSNNALTDLNQMQALLQRWTERRWLRALDAQLPQTLHQLAAEPNPLVWLLSALLCHQYGRGHSCILLQDLLSDPDGLLSLPPQNQFLQRFSDRPSTMLQGLTLQDYRAALAQSAWLQGEAGAPLVLADERLYLNRLYQAEQQVKQQINRRVSTVLPLPATVTAQLEALFPPAALTSATAPTEPDWQKLACAMALQRRFAIITGGPGTGKTTTVVKLLALLQQGAALNQQRELNIKLAAPTGKAAVRLTESISGALSRLPAELTAAIPTEVTTLHRLLGALPNRRSFKHNSDNPLQLDVLVVDEASMVDLEMMAALLAALPERAQLVLLGDKDQLSSVEAGSVLGDLCRGADLGGYSSDTLALLTPFTALPLADWQGEGSMLNQATVMLRHSHRFDSKSGIGQLAAAVNRGDIQAPALFTQFDDITLLAGNTPEALKAPVVAGYSQYLQLMQQPATDREQWAGAVLGCYSRFQLLCALRSGDWGVEGLNRQISQWLSSAGLIDARQHWYAGRPVMMQRNNYSLGLMNGDIGITLVDPQSGQLRVVFQLSDGSLKWVLPSRLSEVETAFAITVHKSQGSEFNHCCLVLPADNSPLLSRELLYTGITRAKQQFTLLCANPALLPQAIARRVARSSGL
ncbi:DNA helicase/exodeoxyribonuclease V, alpha subunit [Rheinheimera pacifica]|uniref:RecBCD enzyme subunit RecD n=1 Tax=Rheinheimera pacifica TaxID=173990 RepID=A0A1H6JAV4_9GAMM|nr:exodeoxyribonuclease V subunit alpha [Rheinheimera pacifica]SEH56774.1 DNA helicase/exodeoxyribonuclease V, alpha subunit [Rheinheimera pacifica]